MSSYYHHIKHFVTPMFNFPEERVPL